MLALENDFVPASLHAEELNQAVDFEDLNIEVNRVARPLRRSARRRLAGVNSFGFGGTNVHVVISDPRIQHLLKRHNLAAFSFYLHTHSRRFSRCCETTIHDSRRLRAIKSSSLFPPAKITWRSNIVLQLPARMQRRLPQRYRLTGRWQRPSRSSWRNTKQVDQDRVCLCGERVPMGWNGLGCL